MKAGGLVRPLGFRLACPQFSWKIEAPGKVQVSFRLTVREEGGGQVYDSGIVLTDEQRCRAEFSAAARTRYFWTVEVCTDAGAVLRSPEEWFETGAGRPRGKWIAPAAGSACHPLVGKTFSVGAGAVRARLYIAGAGLFVPFLNGERVGEDLLAPGCTDYRRVKQVYTYELRLREGQNRLEVLLGNGWYKGRFAGRENIYGDKFLLLAEVEVRYADGRRESVQTDLSWDWRESAVIADGIYDGEVQDHLSPKREGLPVFLAENEDTGCLRDRMSVSVRAHPTETPPSVLYTPKGETVLDFGQNMAGIVRFSGNFESGAVLKLEFGEVLDAQGNFYNENLRSARQTFEVRASGGYGEYSPLFTYFGFRYVRLGGFSSVGGVSFRACSVHSDMVRGGGFSCSDEVLSRFYENTVWGQLSNFVDIPTDCPQRDERFGWLGDAQVFAETSLLHFDCAPFWRKFLADIDIEIFKYGAPPDFAPFFGDPSDGEPMLLKGSSGWADAVTIVTDAVYRATADEEVVRAQYPYVCGWAEYMLDLSPDGLFRAGTRYGDWLARDGDGLAGKTDPVLISTAFCYRCLCIAHSFACLLGLPQDARRWQESARAVRRAWRGRFLRGEEFTEKTQTAYALALRFGLLEDGEKDAAAANLLGLVKESGWVAQTGFIGTAELLYALSDNGFGKEALELLTSRNRWGWMYPVLCGATTVWERTDGYDKLEGAKEMNSFNHYQGGTLASWIYTRLCGFERLCAGGTKIRFRPLLSEKLGSYAGKFTCIRGEFSMSCTYAEGAFEVSLRVPFGCEAEWDGERYFCGTHRRRIPCICAETQSAREELV